MVFWVPLIMGAAALSGAIMSANGKKYIDPNWIEEHTGSHAFAQEFNKMFNQLQSSPQGQEMINSAMSQGAQISNAIKQNATNAGFGGAEGVQSGGSLFATSVADSAPSSLRRMATAAIGQQAQGSVNDILQRRLNAYLMERQQPSKQEVIGNLLQQGGMLGLQASLMGGSSKTGSTPTGTIGPMTEETAKGLGWTAEGGWPAAAGGAAVEAAGAANVSPTNVTPTTPASPVNAQSNSASEVAPGPPVIPPFSSKIAGKQDKNMVSYAAPENNSRQFAFNSTRRPRGAFRNFPSTNAGYVGRLGQSASA